ncbi:dihydropteroate synthase [Xylanimonas protaetiae]|uniref:Dihydropteroate synthase n=1 Tax=Xylanimonas protaetiae TaxID=2509457 RepID=A0A4V0YG85_9MICO|nr:dihydropteroate synthase [Xylanimonas protaetiae]QAY70331.1 dihydropteroate synthase [Xylanimonas protaetiae]
MSAPDPVVPPGGAPLVLRGRELGRDADGSRRGVVMAILNRTTDSFYAPARKPDDAAALDAAHRAWEEGAEILDVGGVRAGVGPVVDDAEEIRRVVPFVARVRAELPDLVLSVDTWRASVAREAIAAGADLVNDTWAGADPHLVEVAGEAGVGVVCSHTGGATPRTDPHRVAYPAPDQGDPRDGVLLDVVATLRAAAARAVACGVPAASVLVDPTHDFGKNTWHSLHLLRRTPALAGLGHPLLMALSRKDFVGETLGLPPDERLEGTLAATALAAWLGARVFRAHDVAATRRVLDLVAVVRDEAVPAQVLRGLA